MGHYSGEPPIYKSRRWPGGVDGIGEIEVYSRRKTTARRNAESVWLVTEIKLSDGCWAWKTISPRYGRGV